MLKVSNAPLRFLFDGEHDKAFTTNTTTGENQFIESAKAQKSIVTSSTFLNKKIFRNNVLSTVNKTITERRH